MQTCLELSFRPKPISTLSTQELKLCVLLRYLHTILWERLEKRRRDVKEKEFVEQRLVEGFSNTRLTGCNFRGVRYMSRRCSTPLENSPTQKVQTHSATQTKLLKRSEFEKSAKKEATGVKYRNRKA